MNEVKIVYKPIGVTPLQLVESFKKEHPEYNHEKISYAGRLDPMAHGVMVLPIGEANKNREEYLHFDKSYIVLAMLGVATDTYDILGLITQKNSVSEDATKNLESVLHSFQKTFVQIYPPFSSKTINGVSLFQLAREGKLKDIVFPERKVTISSIEYRGMKKERVPRLKKVVMERISQVEGDFRQKEILSLWKSYSALQRDVVLFQCTIDCSSGTYVRALVNEVGQMLGCGATVVEILRTRVGMYSLENAEKIKSYEKYSSGFASILLQ